MAMLNFYEFVKYHFFENTVKDIFVTDNEFLVPEGMVIMSETDLHGTITKINDAFTHWSG